MNAMLDVASSHIKTLGGFLQAEPVGAYERADKGMDALPVPVSGGSEGREEGREGRKEGGRVDFLAGRAPWGLMSGQTRAWTLCQCR